MPKEERKNERKKRGKKPPYSRKRKARGEKLEEREAFHYETIVHRDNEKETSKSTTRLFVNKQNIKEKKNGKISEKKTPSSRGRKIERKSLGANAPNTAQTKVCRENTAPEITTTSKY